MSSQDEVVRHVPTALEGTGALAWVAAMAGAGVFVAGVADRQARAGQPGADLLLWLGILVIVVPAAARTLQFGTSRTERLGAAVAVGVGFFLVKVMNGGGSFVFGDELTHWRTAADILASGQLFGANPLSVVSPSYPGLELVTTAIASIGGVPIETAGTLVIGAARLILVLSLFLFTERVTGSDRLAGIASLVYAANPNFAFWSAQFSYESLALPLAVLVLYLAIRQGRAAALPRRSFEVAALVIVFAVVVTHHLTSYALLVALAAWSVASVLRRRVGRDRTPAPLAIAAVTAAATLAWLLVMRRQTLGYIVPALTTALLNIIRVFSGQRTVKTLFAGDPSLATPVWERVVAFAAVGLISAAVIAGVAAIWPRIRSFPRLSPASLVPVLAVASLAYLPLQGLRLVQGSTEISNRSADFLFVPAGLMAAVAVATFWRYRGGRPRAGRLRLGLPAAVAVLVVLIAGGVVIGTPLWARIPGGYAVVNDTRAIQPETIATAAWLQSTFGPSNRFIGDQASVAVLGSYGFQSPVFGASWIFFSPGFGQEEIDAIRATGARFLVIDRRITTALPLNGFYFENREPGANRHTEPLSPDELAKLDATSTLRRIYDGGDFTIYEVVAGGVP